MQRPTAVLLAVALMLCLVVATGAQEQPGPEQVLDALNELLWGEMRGDAHADAAALTQFVMAPPDGELADRHHLAAMMLVIVTLFADPRERVIEVAGDEATITYDPRPFAYSLKRQDGQWRIDVAATYSGMPASLREMLDRIGAVDRPDAQQAACLSNLKQIAIGMLMYAQDHDMHLPDAATWMDDLMPYLRNPGLYHCPAAPHLEYGYAMNASLSGRSLAEVTEEALVVIAFDCDSGTRNAAGGADAVADPPRHGDGNNYAFVDGHCKWSSARPSFGDLPQPDMAAAQGPVGTSTDATFTADVLQVDGPVVVLFWSAGDAPSARMLATLRSLAGQHRDRASFTAMQVQTAPQTAEAYDVTAFPTLMLFRDGEVQDRLAGSWDQDAVGVWLEVKLGG